MIPESEWKFFEGTEQRQKHLARHRAENRLARLTGGDLPWDPEEIAARQAAALQEQDYPSRLEAALGMEPTPEEARHLDLHRRWALQALFETHPDLFPLVEDLERRWAAFRPEVGGAPVTWTGIDDLLRNEPDRDLREAAWKAAAPFAESIREDVKELVRRREQLARAILEAGFPAAAFHFGEMDRSEIVGLLDMLERFTRKAFEEAKEEIRRSLDLHEIEPWDLDYGLARLGELPVDPSRDAAAVGREQAVRWGFPPERLPAARPAPDLLVDGRPIWVDVPRDLCFLYRPGGDWRHLRAGLCAFGGALHGAHIGARRHFLELDSPAAVEASGRLFEAVLDDPRWLAETTGAGPEAIEAHLRTQRIHRILDLRRHAAQAAFENLVYAASDLDPQRLYADVREHMLQETRRPEAVWASHPDLVLTPLASGAAIAGALFAAQARRKLRTLFPETEGGSLFFRPEVGEWIRVELMEPGARKSLSEKILHATGEPLGLSALAEELGVHFEGPSLEESEELSDQELAEYLEGPERDPADFEGG